MKAPGRWAPECGGSLAGKERLEGTRGPQARAVWRRRLRGPRNWAQNWALGPPFPGRPPRALCSQAGRAQVSSHPALPQASWLRGWGGGSLCACRPRRQLSAHRGPFVLAANSARRAAGNRAHSPHPLLRPPAVGQCHSRLARRPPARGAGTGNRLPVLTSGAGVCPGLSLHGAGGGATGPGLSIPESWHLWALN